MRKYEKKKFDRRLSLTEAQDQRPKAQWERNVFGRLLGISIYVHISAIVLCFGRVWPRRKRGRNAWLWDWSHSVHPFMNDHVTTLEPSLLLSGFLSLEVFLGDVMAGLTSLRLRQSQASWQRNGCWLDRCYWWGCHWSLAQNQGSTAQGSLMQQVFHRLPDWKILEGLVCVLLRRCLRNSPIVIAFVGSRSSSGKDWKVSRPKLTCSQRAGFNENLQLAWCERCIWVCRMAFASVHAIWLFMFLCYFAWSLCSKADIWSHHRNVLSPMISVCKRVSILGAEDDQFLCFDAVQSVRETCFWEHWV